MPRYDQLTLKLEDRKNKFHQVLSPNPDDAGIWIHQNAWFHPSNFDNGSTKEYKFKSKGNGLYAFNLSGEIKVYEQGLLPRDGFGILDIDAVSDTNAEFLLMEVSMVIKKD